jgi:hypothetical protein
VSQTKITEGVPRDDQVLLPAEDTNLREPYREYFLTKRKNYLAVVRDLPELWD